MAKMEGRLVKNYGKKGGYDIMLREKGSYWAKWSNLRTKALAEKEMTRVVKRHNVGWEK